MSVNRCPNPSCAYFNRVLPTNANVCPMCGTGLGNAIASAPPPSTPPPTPLAAPPPQPQIVQSPPQSSSAPDRTQYQSRPAVPTPAPALSPQIPALKLTHSSGQVFHLVGESGHIGRRSLSQVVAPEIDLTGLPGEDIISRQHARLAWDRSHNAYTIVDLSTNGIYLNGNLLTTGVPYRLLNGDTLQLGQENLVNFKVAVI